MRRPRFELVISSLLLVAVLLTAMVAAATPQDATAIVLYTRRGCPRCDDAKAFVEQLQRERPGLQVEQREIDRDAGARRELAQRLETAGVRAAGVPALVVSGKLLVGFDRAETTGQRIRELLDSADVGQSPMVSGVCALEAEAPCQSAANAVEPLEVETSLFGRLSVSRLGLPLFTLALGLLDGFNPCAMWVLLFLLAMLAGQRDRKRMAVTAGTFVVASGLVYYAFMAAWLNVFLLVGVSRAVQVVLGAVALAIGALNLKDFVAIGSGPSLSIPRSAKPGIYARVRQVLRADTLAVSALGVAVLAVLVNFVELLCTAGFPAIYTSVLARLPLSPWSRAGYLGLYNLAYVADDALVVTLAVVTLSRRRMTERAGRWLKLLSGAVMLALGGVLLVAPQWLP